MIILRNALVALLAASYCPMKALAEPTLKCFTKDGFPEACYDYQDGDDNDIPGPREWQDFDEEREWSCGGIVQSPVRVYSGKCDQHVQYHFAVSHDAVYCLPMARASQL